MEDLRQQIIDILFENGFVNMTGNAYEQAEKIMGLMKKTAPVAEVPCSDRVSAPISCLTCRRCKRDESQNLHCKYRGQFIVMSEDKPCENWLPSKKDLRIWLAR